MNKPLRNSTQQRRGVTIALTALLMVFMVGMLALAIDLGYVMLIRTELQAAADTAALAGAGATINGTAAAEAEAIRYASYYQAGGRPIASDQVNVQFGTWDSTTRQFTADPDEPTAARVTVENTSPLFFARIFGDREFHAETQAVATVAPRDIMLVLDFSGSMCFDSQLSSIDALGQANIEANLLQIYQDLGSPTFGNMQWDPVYISSNRTNSVKNTLGLRHVPYPYPSGSWDDYINYVKNDYAIARAGYRKRYGYLTWVNYLQAREYGHSQTPDLWMTDEQPVTAVKDATDLLADYLEEKCEGDRLGLSVYTASNGDAVLESSLTHDFTAVADIARHRQAGHYQPYTNIYAGMHTARIELQDNARTGAAKLMVLMTDGNANRPGNTSTARTMALSEAQACADAKIPIVTISLGADADTDLMQEIATITKGVYFEIPGGQTVAEYEEQLKDVFRRVAADRELRLVQ